MTDQPALVEQRDRDAASLWDKSDFILRAFARHRQPDADRSAALEAAFHQLLLYHESGGHEGDGSDEALADYRALLGETK